MTSLNVPIVCQSLVLLVPSSPSVTRVAGVGGDGKGKGRKSLSLAFLLPITPRAPLERDSERRLGTGQMRGE